MTASDPMKPTHYQRQQSLTRDRRLAIVSIAVLLWIAVVDGSLRSFSQYSIRSSKLRGADQYKQWKSKRKQSRGGRILAENVAEWEDDDDDTVTFHLQDDDATSNNNSTDADVEEISNNDNSGKTSDKVEDSNKNKNKNGKGKQKGNQKANGKQDQGIIYSDNVGSKESDALIPPPKRPPPPPPPLPDAEKENVGNSDEKNVGNSDKLDGSTSDVKDSDVPPTNDQAPNDTSDKNKTNDQKQKKQQKQQSQQSETKINNTTTIEEEDSTPADTIFDDLLRGFTFAALFSIGLICFYKCCTYACIRCGFLPDERVVEARWRRLRLKRKKSYRNANTTNNNSDEDDGMPPLDTRKWGEWMSKRETVERAGVWDSGFAEDLEREDGYYDDTWDDEDSIGAGGSIEFDVEMATWDNNDDNVKKNEEMELEYGEGDDLEDKSHDSRLFDAEDGGLGMEKEADMFFKGKDGDKKKRVNGETKMKKNNGQSGKGMSGNLLDDGGEYDSGSSKNAASSNQQQPPSISVADQNQNEMSDDHFFDALQPPSGKSNGIGKSFPDDSQSSNDGNDDDPSPASQGLTKTNSSPQNVDLLGFGNDNDATKENTVGDDDNYDDEYDNDETTDLGNSFDADDRGYDEETDLLGLRSDSPPPLDLEEMSRIEQKLKEDMENAKLY